MSKVSIASQILEADREIEMRRRVYPGQVRHGKMREAEADLLIGRMLAIRETLAWCQANRADVEAWIAAGKPKEDTAHA